MNNMDEIEEEQEIEVLRDLFKLRKGKLLINLADVSFIGDQHFSDETCYYEYILVLKSGRKIGLSDSDYEEILEAFSELVKKYS